MKINILIKPILLFLFMVFFKLNYIHYFNEMQYYSYQEDFFIQCSSVYKNCPTFEYHGKLVDGKDRLTSIIQYHKILYPLIENLILFIFFLTIFLLECVPSNTFRRYKKLKQKNPDLTIFQFLKND